jgi:hypothetical protein
MAMTPLENGDMTMTKKGQAQATRPIPDWTTLRPPVTEALLADITLVDELLYRFEGRRLRLPQASYPPPAHAYVAWHRKEVFRVPARTSGYPRVHVIRSQAAEE